MFGHVSAGSNYPIAKRGGDWRSLVIEVVLTAILVTVILTRQRVTGAAATTPPWHFGATVAANGLFASPISGASMNPTRTFGPDIAAVDFTAW